MVLGWRSHIFKTKLILKKSEIVTMKVPLSPLHTRRRPHKPLMAIFGLLSCIYVFVFCVFVFVICIFVFCEGRPGGGPTSHWCLSIALPMLESSNLIRNSFETRSGLHWHKIFYNIQINDFIIMKSIHKLHIPNIVNSDCIMNRLVASILNIIISHLMWPKLNIKFIFLSKSEL